MGMISGKSEMELAPTGPFTTDQVKDGSTQRGIMVREQLFARGISNPAVLQAMEKVPRHLFVPPDRYSEAYEDRPLPIGFGQTVSQPYMVACMTQLLNLPPVSKVLEIGMGSGYQTAVLAECGCSVTAVERIAPLARNAYARLRALGYETISAIIADGSVPCFSNCCFDRVLIAAACPEIPWALAEVLSEGGMLIAPVGNQEEQRLLVLKKLPGGRWQQEWNTACRFVPLIGRHGWPDIKCFN